MTEHVSNIREYKKFGVGPYTQRIKFNYKGTLMIYGGCKGTNHRFITCPSPTRNDVDVMLTYFVPDKFISNPMDREASREELYQLLEFNKAVDKLEELRNTKIQDIEEVPPLMVTF